MTRWLALALTGCAASPAVGDLDLVLIPAPGTTVRTALADLDQLELDPCDGDPVVVEVGRSLDLLVPEPLPVPVGPWCGVALRFADGAFDGSLRLGGAIGSSEVALALDPGLASRPLSVDYRADTEGVLALDLALLLDIDRGAVADQGDVAPDDALGETLADRVGDALVWFESPADAASVYVDLWPDFDLSLHADVDVRGCDRGALTAPSDGTAPATGATVTGDPTPGGGTTGGGTSTSGGGTTPTGGGTSTGGGGGGSTGGGGTSTGGGSSSGCSGGGGSSGCGGGGSSGCDGGSSASCECGADTCSTTGLAAPLGWATLATFLAARRRR